MDLSALDKAIWSASARVMGSSPTGWDPQDVGALGWSPAGVGHVAGCRPVPAAVGRTMEGRWGVSRSTSSWPLTPPPHPTPPGVTPHTHNPPPGPPSPGLHVLCTCMSHSQSLGAKNVTPIFYVKLSPKYNAWSNLDFISLRKSS